MGEIEITDLNPEDTLEAAALCAAAFIETPLTRNALGGTGEKQKKFLLMGMKMMMKAPGQVFAAKDGDEIVGVMRIVEWPDCQKSTPQGLARLPGLLFGGKAFRNLLHFRNIWKSHDPTEPHWHLDPLCVLPERQGQGIGSRLLSYYTEHLDRTGTIAYHETDQDRNEQLYNRFGFVTVETEPIFGVRNCFMRREQKQTH
jgi:GNAT superfamily N-acetyltransferase